jgi:hypothetical protein
MVHGRGGWSDKGGMVTGEVYTISRKMEKLPREQAIEAVTWILMSPETL